MIVNDYNQIADSVGAGVKDRSSADKSGHDYLNAPIIIQKWPRIIRWAFMIGAAASLWTALVAIFYLV